MSDRPLNSNRLRRWWLKIKRHPLLVGLLVYALLSAFYQTGAPLIAQAWMEEEGACLRDICLAFHYPRTVPLEPEGEAGRPITVWVWDADPLRRNVGRAVRVVFYTEGDGLIFTDEEGNEIPHFIEATIGPTEPEAPRSTLYVRRQPDVSAKHTVYLHVMVYTPSWPAGLTLPKRASVQTETIWRALLRRLFDFFLGTEVFTFAAAAIGVVKLLIEERERRRKEEENLRERIRALSTLPPSEVGRAYLEIWRSVKRNEPLQFSLRLKWQEIRSRYPHQPWLFQVRREIANQIGQVLKEETPPRDFDSVRKLVKEVEEANLGVDTESVEAINKFLDLLEKPKGDKPAGEDTLRICLSGFRALGLESLQSILEVASRFRCDTALRTEWYERGGAAGRYLLHRLAECVKSVESALQEWEKGTPPPPRETTGLCLLWPQAPPALSEGHTFAIKELLALAKEDRDANWFTSFGPVKAEEDPRLPTARFPREKEKRKQTDLFWARHPLWEEIKVARSALFVAPPKSGRTAFIWMGRYERRFWGLSPALSLYLPLDGPPDKEVLLHSLRNALGESLLCALAEDPFWLLDAPSDYQARLCSFLINWAGDPVELFHRMAIRGLREGDPDVRLLRELLLQYSSSSKDLLGEPEVLSLLEMARETLGEAARYRLRDPTFSTFLWVDVKGEKGPGWVRLLQGWERLRQTAHLKIFTPQDCPFEPRFYLEWREKDIRNLLEHRWEKVKLDESAWETIRKILMQVSTPPEGWEDIEWNTMKGHLEDSWEGLREWLVQRAERSPSRLILEGNRLLETYGRALK